MESVSEGGEGREGSEIKRGGEGRQGSARVGEGQAKSSSFFISTMKDFSIFTVQSLHYLKVAGWTLLKTGNWIFCLKFNCLKKWAIEYLK